jgi:4-alpha-glucanotransferase
VDNGLLTQSDIQSDRPNFGDQIKFREVFKWKYSILNRAYNNYKEHHFQKFKSEIDLFVKTERYWLDDYTLYMAIQAEQHNQSWSKWPKELKQRDENVLEEKRQKHADIIDEHTFLQYIFFYQWNQLKTYANQYEITILGGN